MYSLDTSKFQCLISKKNEKLNRLFAQDALQELQLQIDKCEADIESLSVSLKKKKSDRDVIDNRKRN